jgi:hypothetical protein
MEGQELRINEEFKGLTRPLTTEEYELLKQSIMEEGCRDAIIAWDDVIIDGHNRYAICTEYEINFEIEEMDFDSEQEAMLWIINNQLGRRNLSDFQKIELMEKKKYILLEKGRERQREAGNQYGEKHPQEVLSLNDKSSDPHDTRQEIAKELGMSTGKVAQAEILIKEASEEMKERLRSGEIKIGTAHRELKEEKEPEEKPYWSNAKQFEAMAISQLKRIDKDDPEKKEVLLRVIAWCQKNL